MFISVYNYISLFDYTRSQPKSDIFPFPIFVLHCFLGLLANLSLRLFGLLVDWPIDLFGLLVYSPIGLYAD